MYETLIHKSDLDQQGKQEPFNNNVSKFNKMLRQWIIQFKKKQTPDISFSGTKTYSRHFDFLRKMEGIQIQIKCSNKYFKTHRE